MKIPHSIDPNTSKVYEPSRESLKLLNESERLLKSDDLEWDQDLPPTVEEYCVRIIARNFEKRQLLDELPCQDFQQVIELISLDLPLDITVPLIDDEFYWQRKYDARFHANTRPINSDISWKKLFIKRHVEEMIEQAEPQYEDEISIAENLGLFSRYIEKLKITQLKAWKVPLNWDEEDIPEKLPVDHIDFGPIFKRLPNLREFDVVYGMKNITDNFKWDDFELSVQDCLRLGKAVTVNSPLLQVLRIHRSNLGNDHIRQLLHGLIKNQSVVELDLSHCLIGDEGAICIAKFLTVNRALRKLDLTNNKIGVKGAEGLGFALTHEKCAFLGYLSLRLNPLGNDGVFAIMRALIRMTDCSYSLDELSLAATLFTEETGEKFHPVLKNNRSLKKLDVSCNYFGDIGGEALLDGLLENNVLHTMDIRKTNIPETIQSQIRERLKRNERGEEKLF